MTFEFVQINFMEWLRGTLAHLLDSDKILPIAGVALAVSIIFRILLPKKKGRNAPADLPPPPSYVSDSDESGEKKRIEKADREEKIAREERETAARQEEEREREQIRLREERTAKKKDAEMEKLFNDDFKLSEEKKKSAARAENLLREGRTIDKEKEQDARRELSGMLDQVGDMVARGLNDAQITRLVSGRSAAEIPAIELIPTIEALRALIALSKSQEKEGKGGLFKGHFSHQSANASIYRLVKGDISKAVEIFNREIGKLQQTLDGVSYGPKKAEIMQEMGDLYRHTGILLAPRDMTGAITVLQYALEVAPNDLRNNAVLAQYMFETGETSRASQACDKVFELAENAPQNLSYIKDHILALQGAVKADRALLHAQKMRMSFADMRAQKEENSEMRTL